MEAGLTVREARDRYLQANRLDTSGYGKRLFVVRLGFIPLPFPNPGLLHLHDLHHVVTGFETNLVGEAEISVYELCAGCRTFVIHLLCLGSILFALLLAPRRLLRAYRRSRGTRSLYWDPTPLETILEMRVGELRAKLGVPEEGLAA